MSLIQHPAYAIPRKLLQTALDSHIPGHMVFLIGPSGVGKTTMRHAVMREMFGSPLQWGLGRIPVIEAFALLPSNAYFSSRELARSLVEELQVPTLKWLLEGGTLAPEAVAEIKERLASCAMDWDKLRPKIPTEGQYWDAFRRSAPLRGCKYVSVDQVTALLVNHKDTSPADHVLHLMALAETCGVMFIMTGVHSATKLWTDRSELRRRVQTVWVPPYSDKRPADRAPFLRLLKSLSAKYVFSQDDLLKRMDHEILAATGGVIGEIVQLLKRAKVRADQEGLNKLLKRHIEDSYYGNEDLATLWRDIDAFEDAMAAGNVSHRAALAKIRWSATPPSVG